MITINPRQDVAIQPGFIANPMLVGPDLSWTTNLQPRDWASDRCAAQLAARYGGTACQMTPYYPDFWRRTIFSPQSMWFVRFVSAGKAFYVNAGFLATIWQHNPTANVADLYCIQEVQGEEAFQSSF